jgi:hypothetical protein
MGVIKKLKSPDRVLVCIGGEALVTEKIGTTASEIFDIGRLISFVTAAKLQSKNVPIPQRPVKIRFDQPSGNYQVLFMEPVIWENRAIPYPVTSTCGQ